MSKNVDITSNNGIESSASVAPFIMSPSFTIDNMMALVAQLLVGAVLLIHLYTVRTGTVPPVLALAAHCLAC